MHVSSNRPVSEDEEKLMMYSPGGPFIMVVPVVKSWAVAGQRMVFLHMYLQTRVTLKAFPVATPRGRSSSSHEGEHKVFDMRSNRLQFLSYEIQRWVNIKCMMQNNSSCKTLTQSPFFSSIECCWVFVVDVL